MDPTVRHAARPSVRKDRGPFLFRARLRVLAPFIRFSGAIGESFSSPSMVRFAETYFGVRVALAPSRRAFGCEAADRCRYTLAHLRSTESRIEQEASHQIPPITSLVDTWAFKGMTMIN